MSRKEFDELPKPRRRVKYDWYPVAAQAREASPAWVQAFKSVPKHTVQTVTRGQVEAFRATDGRFEAAIRKGSGRGWRLFVRFIPYTDEELMKMEESNDE